MDCEEEIKQIIVICAKLVPFGEIYNWFTPFCASAFERYSVFGPAKELNNWRCARRENSSARVSYSRTQAISIFKFSSCVSGVGYLCGSHGRDWQFAAQASTPGFRKISSAQ